MGEQRGFAPLLTVDLASVTVELNLCESGARFPCKWSSVLEIYRCVYVSEIISFLVSVLASVVGYYICKWLDGDDSDN